MPVRNLTAPVATPVVFVGRTTEHASRLVLMKGQGSGMIGFVWNISLTALPLAPVLGSTLLLRSGNVDAPVDPGLIVLRESGLSRQEQWARLIPVVEHVKKSGDEDFLLNKLIEITGVRQFRVTRFRKPEKPDQKSKYALAVAGSVGYSAVGGALRDGNTKEFSYNKRTMEPAMLPFLALWPYEESITYVLSTR